MRVVYSRDGGVVWGSAGCVEYSQVGTLMYPVVDEVVIVHGMCLA